MRTLHVISHTHWDREWYMPFERHRRRLVRLIDNLLDLLDADPDFRHFHMDGQFIPIEDYLKIRPEQRERIRKAAQAGRLSIGPWYVLQDEFLTSGEAQIRNLMIGMKLSRAFAEPIRLGYLPDSFGNIGQMPQIFRGFGIDNAVFGRGLNKWNPDAPEDAPPEVKGYKSELIWEAPDGSEVLGIFFANWYANAMVIPTDENCVPTVERIRDACLRYATTSHLLLMNGCDHTPSQPDISKAIARANAELTEDRLVHSNFTDYLRAVREEARDLQRARGELRSRYTDGWGTLTNVLSSRLYQKQANWRCQTLLEKWAEPFTAIGTLFGGTDESDFLEYAWKLLLENHPHDSICGCSADEVHREMDTRFAKVEQVAEDLTRDALGFLASKVTTRREGEPVTPDVAPDLLGDTARLVVFNPSNTPRRETIEVTVDFADGTTVRDVEATDADGNPVDAVLLDVERKWDYFLPEVGFRVPYHAMRARVLLFVEVPPVGHAAYWVKALSEPPSEEDGPDDLSLENEFLRVEIGDDGLLTVTEKASGVTFTGLHRLEDSLDVGDEYNYRAPEEDEIVRSDDDAATRSIRLLERNALRTRVEIAGSLPVSDGTLEYLSVFSLAKGDRALRVTTTIENGKRDHRLRALFPTRLDADVATADGQFEAVERPIEPWEGWTNPSDCQPCQAYVDVSDATHGLTIANRGLPEYEVLRDGDRTIAVTLLRCTGRIGDWGDFPTEDSQCLGTNVAEYAIIPHAESLAASDAPLVARDFNAPMRAVQTGSHDGPLPAKGSFLRLTPLRLVLSAVKRAEDRESLIVRFYNPFGEPVTGTLEVGFPVAEVHRVRLDETREAPLSIDNGCVMLDVPGFKIVTLELVPADAKEED